MTVSAHTHTLRLQGSDLELPLKSGGLNFNETSVPMIEGTVTFALPDELEFINQLVSYDPRLNISAYLTSTQRFGSGEMVSVVSSEFTGGTAATISVAWTGWQAKDVSNTYGAAYNSFGMRRSTTKTSELKVQSVGVDFKAMEGTIRLAGRELIAIDFINNSVPITPPLFTVRSAVSMCLGEIGEVLSSAETDDYSFDVGTEDEQVDPDSLVWEVGQSAWDYMNVLVNIAGLRLWADSSGLWHLSKPFEGNKGIMNHSLTDLMAFDFEVSRDGQWYDGALLEYEWVDSSDVRHRAFDFAGNTNRIYYQKFTDRIFPGTGAARGIVDRASKRGVMLRAEGVSDYDAEIGKTLAVNIGSHVLAGMIASISFDLAGDMMVIQTRDSIQTIDVNAWILAPDGYSWDEIVPVIPWNDADASDFAESGGD